ncbi:MAG: adenylate/guanylate cyclase domain-containing protein [Deltaproteobacteria bacterium]|nr:adenylate/guanylate cyclase domain-containing protein [Deltaproteobacteria bacterium]
MSDSSTWRELGKTLIGEPELTSLDVATRAGIEIGKARRLWRALGFPPVPDEERAFTQSDVAVLQGICSLIHQQSMEEQVLLQLTRVTGQALARIAEAQVASAVDRFAGTAEGIGPEPVGSVTDTLAALAPQLEPFHAYVWRRHLLAALLRFAATTGQQSVSDRTLVVGFADLVGFTAISQQLSERDLAALVDRFEALAYEHIPEQGGRVVKMIGDEVMFSIAGAQVGADLALALLEAFKRDPTLPEVRVGLAIGPTLSWEGDLFGPTVNLSSRLVNLARPGTVLISEELGQEIEPLAAFELRHLRPLALKGIGRVRSWVLRRKPTADVQQSTSTRSRRKRSERA